jgi:hypothetical protein
MTHSLEQPMSKASSLPSNQTFLEDENLAPSPSVISLMIQSKLFDQKEWVLANARVGELATGRVREMQSQIALLSARFGRTSRQVTKIVNFSFSKLSLHFHIKQVVDEIARVISDPALIAVAVSRACTYLDYEVSNAVKVKLKADHNGAYKVEVAERVMQAAKCVRFTFFFYD